MNLVVEIERLLDEERDCLLTGNFAALEPLMKRKTELVERLAAHKPNASKIDYRSLLDRARHNDALLHSAGQGLKAAMAQLRNASTQDEPSTYSPTGERRAMSRKVSSVTQKA